MTDKLTMIEIWEELSHERRAMLAGSLKISLSQLALTKISTVFNRHPLQFQNCTFEETVNVNATAQVDIRNCSFTGGGLYVS